jgi:hypothetical protein
MSREAYVFELKFKLKAVPPVLAMAADLRPRNTSAGIAKTGDRILSTAFLWHRRNRREDTRGADIAPLVLTVGEYVRGVFPALPDMGNRQPACSVNR